MELRRIFFYAALLVVIIVVIGCDCRQRPKKEKKIQSRETNIFNFLRLLFLRVVFGIASSLGFSEGISNFMGGIFVPPGVEDDYDDFGIGDDDY